ncbi:MAG: glycosyltransferase [Promethearchaeota archaeon]
MLEGVVKINIKVLFITFVSPMGISGQNITTKGIINSLAQSKSVKLNVICPGNSSEMSSEFIRNIDYILYLPEKKDSSVCWHIKVQFVLMKILISVIRDFKPDLIITRLNPSMIIPPIIASFCKIPYILLARGMLINNIHNNYYGKILKNLSKFTLFVNARLADQVYVAFKEIKEEIDKYRSSHQRKALVFSNAIDPLKFKMYSLEEARKKLKLKLLENDYILGFLGSMKERHCLFPLLEAIEEYKNKNRNIKLLLVGNGPQLEKLKQYTIEKKLENNVIFTGYIPHDEVNIYMAACDVLYCVIHPKYISNPIKCYEYLASGRTIITSKKEELNFVRDNKLGIVIDKVDKNNIIEAIDTFFKLGVKARLMMGEQGRAYVLRYHTWDKLTDLIVNCRIDRE